ncbi:MAG: hypothetical protein QMD97_02490 [Candidatus Aenigmarchaeota archaeon]|nr:hypothetical protein [Candidatus Aenigmarchaeota archaeon]
MDEYKPSVWEVTKEMGKDTYNGYLAPVGRFAGNFLKWGGKTAIVPYRIPTLIRWFKEGGGEEKPFDKWRTTGSVLGGLAGLAPLYLQEEFYRMLLEDGFYGETALMIGIPNAISIGYEKWRGTRKRMIKEHKMKEDREAKARDTL